MNSTLRSFASLLFALAAISCVAAENSRIPERTTGPRVFIFNGPQLEATRQQIRSGNTNFAAALDQLKRDADQSLKAGPFSVVNKTPAPPSGDKHDYLSQAPYFWPDPNSSNGLPYIRRDGERNPELQKISDHRQQDEMAVNVETLALAFYFSGNEAYAGRSAQLIRAWFLDPATRMNPNLQFAQFIPGINTGRGIGLIETRSLARVVDAVGLLAESKAWTKSDQAALQDWFAQFLKWMQESKHGTEENAAKNNHGTYYDVQACSFALFLGKPDLAKQILETAREKRIALQIEPDGRQPLELARTRAWSYSVGNLNGLMLLARLGENVGVDLWNYKSKDGRCIPIALDFLTPYAVSDKKWDYQQLGEWQPQSLYPLLRQAALKYPDRKYQDCVAKLPPIEPSHRSRLLQTKIAAPTGTHVP